MKLDWKLLIATAVAGFVGFLCVQPLYTLLEDILAKPLLIALLVVVFSLICCGAICVAVIKFASTRDEFLFLDSRAKIFAGLAACLVLLFLCAMLFEWIYDYDQVQTITASSYIFVLDESGSMSTNDPDGMRYEAVESVVGTLQDNIPYGVYLFSNDCVRIRDVALPSGDVLQQPDGNSFAMGGQTYISNALAVVYEDICTGDIQVGKHPRVILLTDGFASDMSWITGKGILQNYRRDGISVSTVGLGDADQDLLSEIAQRTKGQYISVDEANQLKQGFISAVNQSADRDLISYRNTLKNDALYIFLRIFFLTLIGAAVAFLKAMVCAGDSTMLIIVEGVVAAFAASCIMEFGLVSGAPQSVCRCVYWMALAITPQMLLARTNWTSGSRAVKTADSVLRESSGDIVRW